MPLRGEVWWVDLDPTRGSEIKKTRPCVVISNDRINRYRNTHIVVALSTTSPKNWPLYVQLPSMSPSTQAVVDQIRAIDKSRFKSRMGVLDASDMQKLDEALHVVLDLEG